LIGNCRNGRSNQLKVVGTLMNNYYNTLIFVTDFLIYNIGP
jgi:hypothetical protein